MTEEHASNPHRIGRTVASKWLVCGVSTVIVGVAIYVGAYVMMARIPVPFGGPPGPLPPRYDSWIYALGDGPVQSWMRIRLMVWHDEIEVFFAPVHAVDVKLRPSYWGR